MKTRDHILLIFSVLMGFSVHASEWSEDSRISILTCSPGDQLYSAYGHTAIRVKGRKDGQYIDQVYNYGTFEFDEGFVWKFTRGKLNYMLSRTKYRYFEYEYIQTNREVVEQVLDLNLEDLDALNSFLENNYKPENRYYLYDFFYDNCATRVRDAMDSILGDRLSYAEQTAGTITFRELIDQYQQPWPWTDFGIDLALGLPCDKVLEPQYDMFLPDFLFGQMERATLDGRPLVVQTNLLVEQKPIKMATSWAGPVVVCWLVFVLYLVVSTVLRKRFRLNKIMDRVFIAVYGLAGCFLIFLWFFTDHTATANNFNLLWAMPLHLIVLFLMKRNWTAHYFMATGALCLIGLLFMWVIPQALHPATAPLMLLGAFLSFKQDWLAAFWGRRV